MPGDTYPKFTVAAVQATSVWLDRDATIEKVEAFTSQAARNGAALVVFSESYIPAFPVWNLTHRPLDQHSFFRRLYDQALLIPSAPFRKLAAIAQSSEVYLSVGITEKTETSMGTLWNSNLLFSPEGRLINWRRKLVATWAEKLTWAPGDASGLKVVPTPLGRIGVLICGENTNTLARFSLLAQGEQVHIAPYPSLWPFNRPRSSQPYDLTQAIVTRAAAHSFEGKLFTVVASGVLDEVGREDLARDNEEIRTVLDTAPAPISLVVGPSGSPVVEPLVGREGIVYAEIDISQNIEHRLAHDITGGYQRFDLFHLRVDQTPYTYTGVEFANHSRYDPLALSKEPECPEAIGEAERERKAGEMSPQLLRGAGSYFFEGSPVGCLLVHGMGSTPYQVRSLGEYLAWQGLTVLGIRLPGHGTTLDELEQTTASQWLAAIDAGIDQLQQTCEHIFVIGNSLGGVLALSIAARRGQDLAGIVTISTPVSATPLIGLLEDPTVPDRFVRPDMAEVLCSDPRVGTFQYPQQSKKVLSEAYEVFKQNQEQLSQIHLPILVINSRKDRSVPLENAHYLIKHVSSTDTTLLILNDSAHLPTLDYDKERVQVACLSFIERILAKQTPDASEPGGFSL